MLAKADERFTDLCLDLDLDKKFVKMNEETLSDVDLEDVSSDESEFEGYSSSNNSEDENEVGNIDLGANPWVRAYPPEDEADPAFSFDETVGPKNCPPPASPPISYVYLFLTVDFLTSIVTHTNNYATNFLNNNRDNLRRHSISRKWTPTTVAEIKAFFAIIINMGLNRKPTLFSYWSKSDSQQTPWFGQVMPRLRFQLLLKFFHLTRSNLPRPGQQGYDACARFQPMIEQFNSKSRHHYTPRQNLSVDESLIGTKNRTQLIQYLPNKHHHKWGIKLWMLCESLTAYLLACFVYRGKRDRPEAGDGRGLAHRVVVTLLQMGSYLRKGYHVFIDNFFTSVALLKELYNSKTYATGTVRQNSKGPPKLIKNKLEPNESAFFRQDFLLATSYREKKTQKKPVLLLSSKSVADVTEVEIRQRGGGDGDRVVRRKPNVVLDYNKSMGGVDQSDMMLYAYLDERRTVKY